MKSDHDRFWALVEKTPYCWNWIGSTSTRGYGRFWKGGRVIPAHWFLLDDYPPAGKEACHKCDNPSCVRPGHIFIGTRSDNMRDMVRKGRHNPVGAYAPRSVPSAKPGSLNHQAKLTEDDALIIKATPKLRGYPRRIAKAFGISRSVAFDIMAGRRWTHLPPPTLRHRDEAIKRVAEGKDV